MVETELVEYADRKPKNRNCETLSGMLNFGEVGGRDSESGSCEAYTLIIKLVEFNGCDLPTLYLFMRRRAPFNRCEQASLKDA